MGPENPVPESPLASRRPLKSRGTAWAQGLARGVARLGVSPDMVSAASVAFAIAGGLLLASCASGPMGPRALALVGAAVCIQLRLLCNLIDGLVAVEHGRGGPLGPLWNEAPDRIADACFLVGAGYGVGLPGGVELGWLAALLAVFTAYVRELGHGLGLAPDFGGPMAKPQRMAVLTVAALVAAVEPVLGWYGDTMLFGLLLIAAGTALTAGLRLRRQAIALRARA